MNDIPWLSLLVFTPWAFALLLATVPALSGARAKWVGLFGSLSTLLLGALIWNRFTDEASGYLFAERAAWIPQLGVGYHLAVDGLSLILVLLTGIVGPLAWLASWRDGRDCRARAALFLVLQGSALGVFLSLDFFLWFVFWEMSLVPAFFLVRQWGGPGAARAAYSFVLYTVTGSAGILLGFAALYAATGTMDFTRLAELARDGSLASSLAAQVGPGWAKVAFLGILLGFAVKAPLFPFHAWMAPTYAEAPTGTAMFLTGVLSKMGVYGFIRVLWPIFPAELHAAAPVLMALALGGVLAGAFAAAAQKDLRRMLAFSSLNHVGYCLVALFAVAGAERADLSVAGLASALNGAVLQAFNHGVTAAALFYCVGILEDRSGGRRGLGDFGGVRSSAPVFAGFCGVAIFSSLGLPGLNGFVGEFLVFRGVFSLSPWAAVVAAPALLATAVFLLVFIQRVFTGTAQGAGREFRDLDGLERLTLAPAVALMVLLGVMPQLLASLSNPVTTEWALRLISK